MKRSSPLALALWSCAALVVAGGVAITVGYVIAARTLDVFDQIPALVSGGIGGIALVVTGCVLGYVQVGRACAERERADDDAVLLRVGTLAALERRRLAAPPVAAPAARPRPRRASAKRGGA
ncbi:MAG TPA: hypothetical protein VG899_07840 [Mycobacteriales bacterium]|nr:hypothetical protein [Mycobacteriales bacterium]HWA66265.1 hypothetical protein [Mycobacteriales bacterium]